MRIYIIANRNFAMTAKREILMITAARPYTVQNRQQQNIKFGNFWTANATKNSLSKEIIANTLTKEQAIVRIDEAIGKEDPIGQKLLKGFKTILLGGDPTKAD